MYILIPLCLCLACIFIAVERQGRLIISVFLKGMASVCFVILGFLASGKGEGSGLILCGLILGAVADVLLNLRYVFKEKGKLAFLAGILVFLSGHIAYLAAVFPGCSHKLITVIAAAVLTALIMKWLFAIITAEKTFIIFGIVYIGAIVLLNCTAFANLAAEPTAFKMIFFAGALLFLVSDIILIVNTFGSSSRFTLRVTNLILYYIGQILIALSLMYL
jgi:uncharacterized membrane protein YhhN